MASTAYLQCPLNCLRLVNHLYSFNGLIGVVLGGRNHLWLRVSKFASHEVQYLLLMGNEGWIM